MPFTYSHVLDRKIYYFQFPFWIGKFTISNFFYIFHNLRTQAIHTHQKLHLMNRIVELRAISKLSFFDTPCIHCYKDPVSLYTSQFLLQLATHVVSNLENSSRVENSLHGRRSLKSGKPGKDRLPCRLSGKRPERLKSMFVNRVSANIFFRTFA